jgi:hypothetical protein
VLDVNRDYQPWLIERARLFSAMDTWDGKKKRGLLLIEQTLLLPPAAQLNGYPARHRHSQPDAAEFSP